MKNENDDFEKGFENGLENIEKGNYEGYLSSEVSLNWLLNSKEQYNNELAQTKELIEKTKAERLQILSSQTDKSTLFDENSHLVSQIENDIATQKAKIETINTKKQKNTTSYSFFAGFLYFLAGITFVAGDLIISHEIVSYALNIHGTYESWAFAVGLASVSILLKPAYERLIEQPYVNEFSQKTKRIHGYFQTILMISAIGTLSVLGWFRYEAFKTENIKKSINEQIQALKLEATPLVQTDVTTAIDPNINLKIEQKMAEYNQLNLKLINSPWAMWSFILSGVLFAIAGAICLGISMPIMQVYWLRWLQLNPAISLANFKIRRKTKALNKLKNPWFKAKTELDLEAEKLRLLPDLEELKTEKLGLETEIQLVNEKIKLAIESARVSKYSDGYESGISNRNMMSDEEFEDFRKKNLENLQQRKANFDDPKQRIYRNNGLRPHQALRKAITNGFEIR